MSASHGFRLILRLHTPLILPPVVPRLDVLLHEAMCRLTQDWETPHVLPLEKDARTGVACASQMVLGITLERPLSASTEKLVGSAYRQDLHLASNVKKRLEHKFPDGGTLTTHAAMRAPFAIFYGQGDGLRCAQLLGLLSGIGREHARHYGAFDVERIEKAQAPGWRLRSWPEDHPEGWAPCEAAFTVDRLSLAPGQPDVAVMRPPRLIREVLNAR